MARDKTALEEPWRSIEKERSIDDLLDAIRFIIESDHPSNPKRESKSRSEALSEDEWVEAAITAMKQRAVKGFVAPNEHLASIRALIQRATARYV